MRISCKVLPILLFGIMLLGLTIPASAQLGGYEDFKLPDVQPPAWSVGQSASYSLSVDGVPDSTEPLSAKIRMALVGKETVEGQEFHWFEMDLSDVKGMPEEMPIPFKVLKVKLLTKYIGQAKDKDPMTLLNEMASGKVIRKIVFQMDEQTPQLIDFMTIQGLAQTMTGQDLQTMLKELPVQEETEAAKDKVQIKTGKETVKVPAGTFTDAPFVWFQGGDESSSGEGKIHAHSKVPITAFVKMAMNIKDTSDAANPANVKIGLDLVEYKMSGALSLIKGEPVPFDFMQFMGGMGEGGMMPGMPMEEE